ncbi:oxygenase MpaB family protein [Gordonia rubripertincta]|uniref:oxygenase MpaB family protein n=1 Tax=Gordonia rubripertincta TaxID=36822 RepID=UPI0015F9345C|nr:oxygenase MpaB family protein [Gordonia rubripertincta]QMU20819.1 DUF2236 domain-containing protein [Gordonia rubripertincta]
MFEQALDNGLETIDDPPQELIALVDHLDNPPSWSTEERVDRGAVVANSVTPAGKASLIFLNTLVTVQSGSVGGAVGTMGRMQRDMISRSLETAEFWLHLPAPGALDRFGIAFKNAVRVRLMHAQARVMLRKKGGEEWVAENGVPISNAEMSGGIPSFGVANLMYDINYGRRYDYRDLEDLNIFWSYIGHIMGIREAMIPRTFGEAVELLDYGYAVMEPPSEFSEALNDVSEIMLNTLMDKVQVPAGRRAGEVGDPSDPARLVLLHRWHVPREAHHRYPRADPGRTVGTETHHRAGAPRESGPTHPWLLEAGGQASRERRHLLGRHA